MSTKCLIIETSSNGKVVMEKCSKEESIERRLYYEMKYKGNKRTYSIEECE